MRIKVEGMDNLLRQLQRAADSPANVLSLAVEAGAEVLADGADSLAPSFNGIEHEETGKSRSVVRREIGPDSDHWYFRFFESGVQPHEIRPKTAKALQFVNGSFSASVSHTGMPAKPFLRPALASEKNDAVEAVGDVIKDELDRL